MMTKEVINEIKIFIDSHEKTDSPMFVYYKPLETNENGDVLNNTGFLTTMDESVIKNKIHVVIYGNEHTSTLNIRIWLSSIVPPSEIDTINIYEKIMDSHRNNMHGIGN